MVQVDIPTPAYWPVIKFRMEIFIAHQYVQFVIGNGNSNIEVALLTPQPPEGGDAKIVQ